MHEDQSPPATDAPPGEVASQEVVRVVIAEDQQLIRRAFATMFQMEADIDVVGQAADGVEAIDLVRRFRPDIVLMDIQMPRLGGIAATRRIVAEHPATQVIALSTFDTDDLVFEAISAGAQAYLLKDTSESEILETIRAVKRGESRLSAPIARRFFEEFRRARPQVPEGEDTSADEPLTEREDAILALVAKGRSNREIADTVFLAEGTVKNYVSRIMEKLHVQTRTELAVKALGRGRR
jgi:DNA-binding NarL/FixJ family response regulator